MLIEATETRITFKLRDGRVVSLEPGVPVELPDSAARQLLAKAGEKVRTVQHDVILDPAALNASPFLIDRPGDRITWTRGDLTVQHGVVDFLQTDPDGTVWAFCTRPDGEWSAVNVKYIRNGEGS